VPGADQASAFDALKPCRRTAGRSFHVVHGCGLPSCCRFGCERGAGAVFPLQHGRFRRHSGGMAGPLRAATAPFCLCAGPRPDAGIGRRGIGDFLVYAG
jgi:hypothetical protein